MSFCGVGTAAVDRDQVDVELAALEGVLEPLAVEDRQAVGQALQDDRVVRQDVQRTLAVLRELDQALTVLLEEVGGRVGEARRSRRGTARTGPA